MSSIWARAAHSVVSSGPVTVTSVNVEDITSMNDQNISSMSEGKHDLPGYGSVYFSLFKTEKGVLFTTCDF